MQKVILCNLDLIKRAEYTDFSILDSLRKELNDILSEDMNVVCFYSGDRRYLEEAKRIYKENYKDYKFEFRTRQSLETVILKNKDHKNYYVIVGKKNADFQLAVNNKILFVVPSWLNMEDKAEHYGVKVDNVQQLIKLIQTLNNHNYWYSKIEVDKITTVFSLMDARFVRYAQSVQEREMIENFERLLKRGASRKYYEILLYHFLSGMTNVKLFDDITLWGMIPSSDTSLNNIVFEFKEYARIINKGFDPRNATLKNVIQRHTVKQKAHFSDSNDRIKYGALKEFETICINPEYKQKIDTLRREGNLNVCIFDDYLTHGNTFEAIRNIFINLGANKIIFVSLGSFCNCYEKNDYNITGDVYSSNYTAKNISHTQIFSTGFEIHGEAKNEIESLYNIFNN